ncbi:MAG: iron-sulfur cluster assembly accessory protein [Candidatus Eisenbacteria bacterium]
MDQTQSPNAEQASSVSQTSSLRITSAAAQAVRQAIEDEKMPSEIYLRIGVKGGGCSGLSYALSFETERFSDDIVIEQEGVRLLLDPRARACFAAPSSTTPPG